MDLLRCLGSMATLTIGGAANDMSVKTGHAMVLDKVADFNTSWSRPPIPANNKMQNYYQFYPAQDYWSNVKVCAYMTYKVKDN